jgi:hypothetical protein
MGAPNTWNPPATARQSPEALAAWVQRAATNAQIKLTANKVPAFNDAYVANVIKNLNVTGVTAKSVPLAYRTNPTALKNYLLTQQAAAKLRAANAARLARLNV